MPIEELSEEDQNLKSELEMLVERLKVATLESLLNGDHKVLIARVVGARYQLVHPRP